ncbi:MAG: FkbM family methyltransferase [Bryobacteraceae bacterium]|nr:FkbM family methyltransferase [Bryobacteraceae bacterium]
MNRRERLVTKLRPAPLAASVAHLLRVNRRRLHQTPYGRFFINPVSDFGSRILAGDYEPEMRRVLELYLKPGMTFIDLGANEGYFSVLASRLVGPDGFVLAIEPQSRLQAVIQRNLMENECFNVQVFQCVLAAESGRASIALSTDMNTGASSLYPTARYRLPEEEVCRFSLSEFFSRRKIGRCHLMKIDIEGAEWDVLMSAGELLRQGIIANLAVEIHESVLHARGLRPEQLHQHLLAHQYECDGTLGVPVYRFRASARSVDSPFAPALS